MPLGFCAGLCGPLHGFGGEAGGDGLNGFNDCHGQAVGDAVDGGVLGVAMLDMLGLLDHFGRKLKLKVSLRFHRFGRGGLETAGGGLEARTAGHVVEVSVFLFQHLDGPEEA